MDINLNQYDWFCGVENDKYGRKVVLTSYMNKDVLDIIPNDFLVHFVDNKNSFVNKVSTFVDNKPSLEEEIAYLVDKYSIDVINTLLFEIQDGDDRVTDFQDHFKEAFQILNVLFKEYGFENIEYVIDDFLE